MMIPLNKRRRQSEQTDSIKITNQFTYKKKKIYISIEI